MTDNERYDLKKRASKLKQPCTDDTAYSTQDFRILGLSRLVLRRRILIKLH